MLTAPAANQVELLRYIATKGLSVREAEKLSKRPPKQKKAKPARASADIRALEERLGRALGTRVTLKVGRKKGSGSISISYEDYDDLDRILSILEK